jgi:exopolysaccharide production protein ExoZ
LTARATPSPTEEPRPLLSIQYLRALAALAVVAYHALQWTGGGFEVGRAGVDVFFVISGFIMWTVTADRAAAPAAFLWRRFTRVAPAYWIATLAVAAAAVVWPALLPQVRLSWPHLALSLAFIPHNDLAGLPFPVLPPGWTLCYEAAFYLIFAVSLVAPERWRMAVLAICLVGVSAAGFVWPPAYPLGANPLMLQFLAGAVLGRLARARALPESGAGWLMLGMGLAAFAIMAATGFVDELWRPLIWGGPAILIVAGAVAIEARGRAPRLPAMKTLGDASYSIYLWHLPAVALVAHILGTGRPWLLVAVGLAASIGAGLASRAWLEVPLTALLRGRRIDPLYRQHVINRLDGERPAA